MSDDKLNLDLQDPHPGRTWWILFLFRLYLFFKGIRFYQTDTVPANPVFKRVVFKTYQEQELEFIFYKETYEDLIYRRGRTKHVHFTGYVIQIRLHSGLPEVLKDYNNLKFFFNSSRFHIRDEYLICRTLVEAYLEFLSNDVVKKS